MDAQFSEIEHNLIVRVERGLLYRVLINSLDLLWNFKTIRKYCG